MWGTVTTPRAEVEHLRKDRPLKQTPSPRLRSLEKVWVWPTECRKTFSDAIVADVPGKLPCMALGKSFVGRCCTSTICWETTLQYTWGRHTQGGSVLWNLLETCPEGWCTGKWPSSSWGRGIHGEVPLKLAGLKYHWRSHVFVATAC